MVPSGGVFISSWMTRNGISGSLQRHYKDSGWLQSIGTGVMIRTGESPTIYNAISCINEQSGKHFHMGAMTALELAGYSHYIPMGRAVAVVCCPKGEWLPGWVSTYDWGVDVRTFTSGAFAMDEGLSAITMGNFKVTVSSPERAFMECLYMAPRHYNLTDLYYVMEQLTTLRPAVVQTLLELCPSIKVKRLFLYMARKAGHAWMEDVDTSIIDLGSGKRVIAAGGIYDPKYQIVLPAELVNYE